MGFFGRRAHSEGISFNANLLKWTNYRGPIINPVSLWLDHSRQAIVKWGIDMWWWSKKSKHRTASSGFVAALLPAGFAECIDSTTIPVMG